MEIEKTRSTGQVNSSNLTFKAAIFSAFLCILFGANATAIKVSLTGCGVFTTGGIRFCGGALAILIWALFTGKRLYLEQKRLPQIFTLSLILFIQLSLFYFGQDKTLASHGALIANLLPFVVMILAHLFIKEDKINAKKIIGLLMGFMAVSLLFIDNNQISSETAKGDCLILLAVVIWGGHVVYIKKIIHHFSPIQITVYPMMIAGPMFIVSGYFFDPVMIKDLNGAVIGALFYQTFITAAFGFVAWNSLIQKYGATALHSFIFIMPISGVLFGILLLGEPLTGNLIGSIVLVVVGLMIVNKPDPKTHLKPTANRKDPSSFNCD